MENRRYLVTGYKGQLGYDVVRELNKRGIHNVLAFDIDDMDITNREEVMNTIKKYKPDCVIHCAAYTDVDKAEENEYLAKKINVFGTDNIADACKEVDAKMVYISTNYVFDGTIDKKDVYYPGDKTNPLSVYGETKRDGEIAALENPKTFVVRTSWLFGINGNNFVKAVLNRSKKYREIKVINDQIGSPTYTVDLARVIVDLTNTDRYGIYHCTNNGFCSLAEFADYIVKDDPHTKVIPVSTEEYYRPQVEMAKMNHVEIYIAESPMVSKMDKCKLMRNNIFMTPHWQDAVDRYKQELEEQEKVLKKEL